MAWVIDGKPDSVLPRVGQVYDVQHSRKGKFRLLITKADYEFAEGKIVSGIAGAIMLDNVRIEGETVAIRADFSHLTEVKS